MSDKIYGIEEKKSFYDEDTGFESSKRIVAYFYNKEDADKECKKLGSSSGDRSHYAYEHTVKELEIK